MLNKKELLKRLQNDIKKLEKKIEHPNRYNLRAYATKTLIKSGIALDYAMPFILSTIIIFNLYSQSYDNPFTADDVEVKAKIQTIDTSTGIHNKKISFDYDYDNESTFQHSTAWTLNDYGIYERTITSYKIDNSIALNNIDKVLSMSKDEIEKSFVITNIEKMQKGILDLEDQLYIEDMIIITKVSEDPNNVKLECESSFEVISDLIIYLICSFFSGLVFKIAMGKCDRNIRGKLEEIESQCILITSQDLIELKKILELKKANLDLLEIKKENIALDNSYKLKRK